MDNIHRFLAHAVRLEAEAARRFEELADFMLTHGNAEVEAVFRRMADYSRLHLKDAMARGGFRHIADLPADGCEWPQGESPEAAPWWGVDGLLDVATALELALESERRGLEFYADAAERTWDVKVRDMAREFAAEEASHVAEIERLLAAQAAGGDA